MKTSAGDLDVDTGDGSVSVAGKLATVKLHTGDGSITFRAAAGTAMKEDWSITTGDGGVAVYLPSDFGAELDAHTGDGSIRNELGLKAEAESDGNRDRDRERDRRTLKGKLGAGGKTPAHQDRRRASSQARRGQLRARTHGRRLHEAHEVTKAQDDLA